jgi:probable F420-dependent oxidoreductase
MTAGSEGGGLRPFRFIAPMPPPETRDWVGAVRRMEDLGFSTVSVSEHLTGGWSMDPLVAMAAAAAATSRLHVLSLVLANDLHRPDALERAATTIHRLSGHRLELGLGAGWLAEDFAVAGVPFAPAATRIARLEATVASLGEQFRTAFGADRPPILVAGGGPRILAVAGRQADIAGIHARLPHGRLEPGVEADFGAERVAAKVGWVRDAAVAAGRAIEDVELQFNVYLVDVRDGRRAAARRLGTFADGLAVDPELVAASPSVLVGSVDQCVELLLERRERYGLSYLRLSEDVEAVAPIIARLAGR